MKITIITQKLDADDYVFGFFYGHIMDLARVCENVYVVCLEKGNVGSLPANVKVYSLGKEEGVGRSEYVRRFFRFLFSTQYSYDTVFVHMEPLYVILGGWWWRLTGRRVILWYNHVYKDKKLPIASSLVHEIIGVSYQGIPVQHKHIRLVTYTQDLTNLLTTK